MVKQRRVKFSDKKSLGKKAKINPKKIGINVGAIPFLIKSKNDIDANL